MVFHNGGKGSPTYYRKNTQLAALLKTNDGNEQLFGQLSNQKNIAYQITTTRHRQVGNVCAVMQLRNDTNRSRRRPVLIVQCKY